MVVTSYGVFKSEVQNMVAALKVSKSQEQKKKTKKKNKTHPGYYPE